MSYNIPSTIYNVTKNQTAGAVSTLSGLCQWTRSSGLCLATVIPIAILTVAFAFVVAYFCMITPQKEVLYELVPFSQSSLLPACCHDFLRENRFSSALVSNAHNNNSNNMMGASMRLRNSNGVADSNASFLHADPTAASPSSLDVEDQILLPLLQPLFAIPLKTFLPSFLDYIIEPCAMLGVSSVGDLLRLNTLALRDVGVGPREVQMLQRELERKVKRRMEAITEEHRMKREEASRRAERL